VRELFAALGPRLKANPDKTAGLTVSLQFNVLGQGGGIWQVKIDDGQAEVLEGPAEHPDLTCVVSVEDYIALAAGEVSGRELFFSGRMHLEGNALLGMTLGRIMR